MSCSALTRLWCTSLRPGRQKFGALCSFCAFYCLRQLDIAQLLTLPFPLAGVSASGARGFTVSNPNSSPAVGSFDVYTLEAQCNHLLVQRLASSTRNSYASGQRKFLEFCLQLGRFHPSGSPCRVDEWTLCLFVIFGQYGPVFHHQGVPFSCSLIAHQAGLSRSSPRRLQQVLRGVKRTQGDASSQRLPITDNVMVIIFKALDVNMPDHCMFWPACCLAYFGFLCSAEFTIPNLASFSSSIHLGVADTVVDSASPPSCLRVRIVFKNRSVSEGVFRAHTPRHISTVCTPNLAVIFD